MFLLWRSKVIYFHVVHILIFWWFLVQSLTNIQTNHCCVWWGDMWHSTPQSVLKPFTGFKLNLLLQSDRFLTILHPFVVIFSLCGPFGSCISFQWCYIIWESVLICLWSFCIPFVFLWSPCASMGLLCQMMDAKWILHVFSDIIWHSFFIHLVIFLMNRNHVGVQQPLIGALLSLWAFPCSFWISSFAFISFSALFNHLTVV